MRIAVLAWGSLIWNPRQLAVSSRWRRGGPTLPVEFARRSQDDRVTLVLMPEYGIRNEVFYALSACEDLARAGEDLKAREGTVLRHVHFATATDHGSYDPDGPDRQNADVGHEVGAWVEHNPDVDAAIWTGLPPKHFNTVGPERLADDVVAFLQTLTGKTEKRAEEYVRNTPSSIRTPVREALEQQLGWTPLALPDHLFEERAT